MDDLVISDNGNAEKVLATVVKALQLFVKAYHQSMVFAKGSSRSRTRFYRIGINKYLDEIQNDFHLWGRSDTNWETYQKGKDYDAFAVKKIVI